MNKKNIRKGLSKSSKIVFDYLVDEWNLADEWDLNYSLSEKESDKPYYIVSWWEFGNCGEFATKEELDETIKKSLLANDRNGYFNVCVFDIKNKIQLEVANLKIDITYELKKES